MKQITFRNFSLRHLALGCAAAMALCGAARAADDDRSIFATLPSGAVYPPGRWMPVNVKLSNRTKAEINGSLTLTPNDDPNGVIVRRNVRVPAQSMVVVELIGRFADLAVDPKRKSRDTATITWTAEHGSQKLDVPITALSDAGVKHNGQEATNLPGVTVFNIIDPASTDERRDGGDVAQQLNPVTSYAFDNASLSPADFPRRAEAMEGARLILIDPVALGQFDSAQREALLTAVRSGATVLLTVPDPSAATSFLGAYLPFDVLGQHYMTALHPTGSPEPLKLAKPCDIADVALRSGAVVTLADARGPLAAYMPLGFGRVGMTAFSAHDLVDGLDTAKVWSDLVGSNRPVFHDVRTLTGKPPAAEMLPQMIGATAPPWFVAAGVVGGYVAVVAVLLLVSGAGRRPMAMAGCVGIAILATGGLLGFTQLRTIGRPLMVGRVTTLDLTGSTALQTDLITFFGQQHSDLSIELPDGATAQPIVTGANPELTLWPASIGNIGASSGKLESVWQIQRASQLPWGIDAQVKFGPTGETLAVNNAAGQAVANPRLIVDGHAVPLPGVAAGTSEQAIGPRNADGVFTDSAAVIADERSKLRTQIVELLNSPPKTTGGLVLPTDANSPMLTGFLEADGNFALKTDSKPNAQTLVRVPLTLQPAAIGTAVQIDPAFNVYHFESSSGIPFTRALGAWNNNNLSGSWTFAVSAPQQMGRMKVGKASFDIDARAGGYHIALRHGQCSDGKLTESAAGPIAVQWNNESGRRTVSFDVGPNDFDANGWLWLRLEVTPIQTTGLLGDTSVQGDWQFMRFETTLNGTVDGPPQPPIMTWPLPEQFKPKPKPPAKAPAKAPATKPKTPNTPTTKKK